MANFSSIGILGNLTVNYTTGGIATGSNSTFVPPANLTINATEGDGYVFVNWTTNCNGSIFAPTNHNTMIQIYDNVSCHAQANFIALETTNCTTGVPIMTFLFFDQDDVSQPVNSTMDATFYITAAGGGTLVYSSNFSTPTTNITICVLGNSTYTVNSIQRYSAVGYRPLYYYLINQTVYQNSTVLTTNLYNLNETTSFQTQYTVLSGANQPIENAHIQILRYYPGTNTLLTASIAKTDLNGIGVSYAIPNDVNYQYIIINNGTIAYTSNIAVLPCAGGSTSCATTILISGGIANPYQAFIGATGVGCWVNQTAGLVYCTSNNPSGTGTGLTVKLWRVGAYGNELICSNTVSTASGTVSCAIPDNQTYYYEGTAEIGSWIDIGRGLINGEIVRKFDATLGLFATAFIVVAMGTIGTIGGLGVGILMSTFGFAIAAMLGFLSIGLAPLAGIVLVGFVLSYVLRG
jgi:hypothetical protein